MLNLKILSKEAMISISGFYLHNPRARALLESDSLGRASLEYIESVHERLVRLHERRTSSQKRVDDLTVVITALDARHDDKARAFYYYLKALVNDAEDEQVVALAQALLDKCFPQDLRIVQESYLDEAGWAESLQVAVSQDEQSQLDAIVVGSHTLGDVYRAWVEAGLKLGDKVHERSHHSAEAKATGFDSQQVSHIKVRSRWIRIMHSVLENIDLMPFSDAERSRLRAPFEAAIAKAMLGAGSPDAVVEPDTDAPTDAPADPDAEAPADVEAGAEVAEVGPEIEPEIEPEVEPEVTLASPADASSGPVNA